MHKTLAAFALALPLALATGAACAQASPAGLWKTIDDETKAEKSLIRLSDSAGVITGRVEKLLDPARQDAKCDKCTDARKDKPVVGMTVLEGVRKADGSEQWDGGTILDPNNGKVYKVRLKVAPDNAKLDVRGYIGTPMIGRTQVWQRVE